MKEIYFNNNKELQLLNHKINILYVKNTGAQKIGLLNHRILPENEGILFSNTRFFHTFGMHFPICVLAFDKHYQLMTTPTVVEPNRVFICPFKSRYLLEINSVHQKIKDSFNLKKEIHILNSFKSKIFFYFLKLCPLLIVIIVSLFAIFNVFASSTLNINLGQTRTVNLEQVPQSIQIDDPDIIDLERIGVSNSVKIIPKQPGKTSITFKYFDANEETININIATVREMVNETIRESQYQGQLPSYFLDECVRQIKKISGIHYSVNAGKIFILGKIKSIEKFKEISKIVAPHPSLFFPGFDLVPSIENKVMDTLNTDIRVMGDKNLKITRSGERFLLKGVSSSESSKEKIWTYLSSILPNIIDSTTPFFGESSLVQINIEFFEVGKSNKKDLGFEYPNLGAAALGFGMDANHFSKPTFQITPFAVFFRALEARNYVREIAKPVIITRSGEKASFLAGGEVPISTVTSSGLSTNVSVNFKSVGILFDVTPRVNDDGTIWVKLNVEYSQINEKLSYQNSPGFNSRKINTNIILKEGSAAIISGLIQNIDQKKMQNIPLLSSIPILGELFKSKNYVNDSTELWIAISALHKSIENIDIQKHSIRKLNLLDTSESLL